MKIRKAVFPVAGLGTRVLPATKAMPKEMLTIVDRPLIQYVVDEAKEAGIEHFIFVTGRNKGVIEDHFDRVFELDTTLETRGKKAEQELLAQFQPAAGAMHIAKLEMSPMVVIWLFYAFESLLQTRVGENFSSLLGRLTSLLGANEQEAKLMKKKLRSLYDIRNGIVHGGLEVSHPIHDESLDKRVDENYLRLSDAADFGYAILLASIQKTIEQGWSYPVFEEKLAGKLIETDRC